MTEKETLHKQMVRWSAISVNGRTSLPTGLFRTLLGRFVAGVLLAALLPMAVGHAQSEGFSCSYTPKSENSSFFYIDIDSSDAVSAAVWELRFDGSKAAYHSFSSDLSDSVRVRADGDRLAAAFASGIGRKGRLCRLTFKKLAAGECDFVLTVRAAADSTPKSIGEQIAYTLTVELGEAGSASAGVTTGTKSASAVSRGGKRSAIGSLQDDDGEVDTAAEYGDPDDTSDAVDLREGAASTYLFLGAGGVLLLGAVGLTVFLLLRRRGNVAADEEDEADVRIGEAEDDSEDNGDLTDEADFAEFVDEDDEEFYNFLEDGAAAYPDESEDAFFDDLTAECEAEEDGCS